MTGYIVHVGGLDKLCWGLYWPMVGSGGEIDDLTIDTGLWIVSERPKRSPRDRIFGECNETKPDEGYI